MNNRSMPSNSIDITTVITNSSYSGAGGTGTKSRVDDSQLVAATACMHKLEQVLPPLIDTWYESYVPIPHSVKIVNGIFFILTSVLHIDISEQVKWRKSTVLCNEIPGGEILKSLERLGRPTLIVKCPDSIKSSNTTRLETLSFLTSSPPPLSLSSSSQGNETHSVVSYNITLLNECERLDVQYFSKMTSIGTDADTDTDTDSGTKKIRIGMTTSFRGNRNRVLEWATYHHFIGIDHFWIYVNEPWDKHNDMSESDNGGLGYNLPHREYITWIPFNFSIAQGHFQRKHNYIPTEHFRIASQNDALWRAKRMRLDWLAIVDLDEYIYCSVPWNSQNSSRDSYSNDIHTHKNNGTILSGKLKQYLAMKQMEYNLLDNYGAVEMNSVPFGRNVNVDIDMDVDSATTTTTSVISPLKTRSHDHEAPHHDNSHRQFLMDYTWRQKGDPKSFPFHRMKLIVNPQKVTAVNIHYIGGGDRKGVQVWSAPTNELRINHYRTPHDGVYDQKHGKLDTVNLEQDTLFRDRYKDIILEKMMLGQ
eukprot:CAMPEP_0176479534 /NCGR_PEP_ID=MMETSP0200_2-20121128/1793_1 /TAXON_ID=947934 /ORGANISM="Chaetoceros sp., Strain GSL56" /LENGTH=532 /DNA_ID=CAMNT_0017875589 /DNA_START=262 /DNA_END=1860 /DNA_ORIENTATION=+